MLPDNLGHLFDAALALIPDQAAVLQDDVTLSFAQLERRTSRLACALRELGVQPGDRVALMFNNDFRFIESLFAPMRLGAVAIPLNTRMADESLRFVVADAAASVLSCRAAWQVEPACLSPR